MQLMLFRKNVIGVFQPFAQMVGMFLLVPHKNFNEVGHRA
jgi:hypothetical protein